MLQSGCARQQVVRLLRRVVAETERNAMIYGHDKTIHSTQKVNVELDKHGQVVAVWFR